MSGEDYRRSVLLEVLLKDSVEQIAVLGVDSGGGLVQDQEVGLDCQRHCYLQFLFVSSRERGGDSVQVLVQLKQVAYLLDLLAFVFDPSDSDDKEQILSQSYVGYEELLVGAVSYLGLGVSQVLLFSTLIAFQQYFSLVVRVQFGNDVQERGFPGSVVSQYAVELLFFELNVYIVQNDTSVKSLRDSSYIYFAEVDRRNSSTRYGLKTHTLYEIQGVFYLPFVLAVNLH